MPIKLLASVWLVLLLALPAPMPQVAKVVLLATSTAALPINV